MAATPSKKFKLVEGSDRPDLINDIESMAEEASTYAGFSEEERDSLAIAVTEMANNAIIHGNKRAPDKEVRVEITAKKGEVHIIIRDQGGGFDPNKLRNPLDPENLLRESGRGVFIVRSLMDEVHFNFDHGGTEVTIIKRKKS